MVNAGPNVDPSANASANAEGTARTPLEERAKDLFDESVGQLDGRTRSALTQARNAALAEAGARKGLRLWGPLTGVAAAAVFIAVVFGPIWTSLTPANEAAMPIEDFDILADADNLELLENLEFYSWVDGAGLPSG
jgi:hypothetical protein